MNALRRLKVFFLSLKTKFVFNMVFKRCKKEKSIGMLDLRFLYSMMKNCIYKDTNFDGMVIPVEDKNDDISLMITTVDNAFKFSILCNPVQLYYDVYGKYIKSEDIKYNIRVLWKQKKSINTRVSSSFEGELLFNDYIDYYHCENTNINRNTIDAIIDLLCDSSIETIKSVKLTDRVIYCERK